MVVVEHDFGDTRRQPLEQRETARWSRPARPPADARRSRRCRSARPTGRRAPRSATTSRSTSKGWARSCSSGSAPQMPEARGPAARCGHSSAAMEHRRPPPARGPTGPIWRCSSRSVNDMACGPSGHDAGPQQIAGDEARDAVAELLAVHEHLGAATEQSPSSGYKLASKVRGSSCAAEGTVEPRDAELVVVVQVVGRRDERDHAGEALLADPDDLLLAADAAVVRAVATAAARTPRAGP